MLGIYQPYEKLKDDTLYISNDSNHHGVKRVRIRRLSGPSFSLIFSHSDWIWRVTEKMRTRITPNKDNFYTVHPSTVIKQIPKAISRSISDISWSKEICDQNISYYNYDLKYKGYENISLPYSPDTRTRAG